MTIAQAMRQLGIILNQFDFWHDDAVSGRYSWFAEKVKEDMQDEDFTLHIVKHSPDPNVKAVGDALKREGWYALGAGHFAIVLAHNDCPGHAFKLSFKPDDAYAAYAMWARDVAGCSPHLPTIHDIQRHDWFIIFALDEYQGITESEYEASGLRDLYNYAIGKLDASDDEGSLCWLAQRIGEFFRGAATIDMHSQNVMWDKEHELYVITDPVSFTKQGEPF